MKTGMILKVISYRWDSSLLLVACSWPRPCPQPWPASLRMPEVGRGRAWRRPPTDQASFKTRRWTDL